MDAAIAAIGTNLVIPGLGLKHFKGIAYKMPVILSTLAGSKVIVKVSLKSTHLDGSDFEEFALSLPYDRYRKITLMPCVALCLYLEKQSALMS